MLDVDLSEAMPEELYLLMDEMVLTEKVLDDLADMAWLRWRNIAVRTLHTSRQDYVNGIQRPVGSDGERVIALVGWLPNAIENGLDSYDLRDTLLLNPNAKARKPIWSAPDKNGKKTQIGWYVNVPFRHGTPTSSGLVGGAMGTQYAAPGEGSRAGALASRTGFAKMGKADAKAFGKSIYAAAKKLRGKKALKGAGPKLYAHHTTSIYTGMKRVRKPYVNAKTGKTTTQSQYVTFRRISTTNKEGWIHPGIEPHRIGRKVQEYVRKMSQRVVKNAVSEALNAGKR